MRQIRNETNINAPPGRVWSTFCDFEHYVDWNPFIVRAAGMREAGRTLDIVIVTPAGGELRFNPMIVGFQEGKSLTWAVGMPIPGLFDRTISFEIEDVGNGVTRFTHTGRFTGLLVPLRGGLIRDLETGYRNMNTAFKTRCEAAE